MANENQPVVDANFSSIAGTNISTNKKPDEPGDIYSIKKLANVKKQLVVNEIIQNGMVADGKRDEPGHRSTIQNLFKLVEKFFIDNNESDILQNDGTGKDQSKKFEGNSENKSTTMGSLTDFKITDRASGGKDVFVKTLSTRTDDNQSNTAKKNDISNLDTNMSPINNTNMPTNGNNDTSNDEMNDNPNADAQSSFVQAETGNIDPTTSEDKKVLAVTNESRIPDTNITTPNDSQTEMEKSSMSATGEILIPVQLASDRNVLLPDIHHLLAESMNDEDIRSDDTFRARLAELARAEAQFYKQHNDLLLDLFQRQKVLNKVALSDDGILSIGGSSVLKKYLKEVDQSIMPFKTSYKPAYVWTGNKLEKDLYVTVDPDSGEFVSVGKDAPADSTTVALPGKILLPGFVNCHSHAFQRGLRGKGEEDGGNFWQWRESMYSLVTTMKDEEFKKHCALTFREMRASGCTCVGEFHYFHHGETDRYNKSKQRPDSVLARYDKMILEAAAEVGIRIVLLFTYYQYGGCDKRDVTVPQQRFKTNSVEEYLKELHDLPLADGKTQTKGIAPHSIRTLDTKQLEELLKHAKENKMVLHMHMEEPRSEIEDCLKVNGKTPLRCLLDAANNAGIDDLSFCTLVHCTHSNEEDIRDYMVTKRGNICVCPLTEGSLSDGIPHHLPNKGQVVVGSDSCLRIDCLEEVRHLEYGQRLRTEQRGHFSISQLVDVLTVNGAVSMGLQGKVGKIEKGYLADFTVLSVSDKEVITAQSIRDLQGEEFLASAIFGCGAHELVHGTAVGGKFQTREELLNYDDRIKVSKDVPSSRQSTKTSLGNAESPIELLKEHINKSSENANQCAISFLQVTRSDTASKKQSSDAQQSSLYQDGQDSTRVQMTLPDDIVSPINFTPDHKHSLVTLNIDDQSDTVQKNVISALDTNMPSINNTNMLVNGSTNKPATSSRNASNKDSYMQWDNIFDNTNAYAQSAFVQADTGDDNPTTTEDGILIPVPLAADRNMLLPDIHTLLAESMQDENVRSDENIRTLLTDLARDEAELYRKHMDLLVDLFQREAVPDNVALNDDGAWSMADSSVGGVAKYSSMSFMNASSAQPSAAGQVSETNLVDAGEAALYDAYISLKVLGQGAFGIVSEVRLTEDDINIKDLVKQQANCGGDPEKFAVIGSEIAEIEKRTFAMKEMRGMSKRDLDLAQKEAGILNKLKNDYIIEYREAFAHNSAFYMVMEVATNGDLAQHLYNQKHKDQPFSTAFILIALTQIASAMDHLHEHKVMHRDLKPANVLVHGAFYDTEENAFSETPHLFEVAMHLKVTDFGLARVMEEGDEYASSACGTRVYMAPEAHKGKCNLLCDVWSIGCILYELCMLERLFTDINPIFEGAVKKISDKSPNGANWSAIVVMYEKMMNRANVKDRPT
eukprot:gene648-348_t